MQNFRQKTDMMVCQWSNSKNKFLGFKASIATQGVKSLNFVSMSFKPSNYLAIIKRVTVAVKLMITATHTETQTIFGEIKIF